MNTIAVDPPFSDSKTKKTTIQREMKVRKNEENDCAYLDVLFTSSDEEAGSLRTAITSFVTNLTLVCETMRTFGN
jgi:hypothetical protein